MNSQYLCERVEKCKLGNKSESLMKMTLKDNYCLATRYAYCEYQDNSDSSDLSRCTNPLYHRITCGDVNG